MGDNEKRNRISKISKISDNDLENVVGGLNVAGGVDEIEGVTEIGGVKYRKTSVTSSEFDKGDAKVEIKY